MDTNEASKQAEVFKIKVTKCVEGVTYPRVYSVHGSVVTCKQTTDLAIGGPHYLEHAIETANMDGDDVLRHAVKDIVIMLRSRVLKGKTATELSQMGYVIDPEDYPPADRVGVPKRDKEIALLVKMKIPLEIAEKMVDDPENALDKISEIEEAITEPDEIDEHVVGDIETIEENE